MKRKKKNLQRSTIQLFGQANPTKKKRFFKNTNSVPQSDENKIKKHNCNTQMI